MTDLAAAVRTLVHRFGPDAVADPDEFRSLLADWVEEAERPRAEEAFAATAQHAKQECGIDVED